MDLMPPLSSEVKLLTANRTLSHNQSTSSRFSLPISPPLFFIYPHNLPSLAPSLPPSLPPSLTICLTARPSHYSSPLSRPHLTPYHTRQIQIDDSMMLRLNSLTATDIRNLLARYFDKVIDLRETIGKKELSFGELEVYLLFLILLYLFIKIYLLEYIIN